MLCVLSAQLAVMKSHQEVRKKENLQAHFCTLRVTSVEQLYSREYLRYHNSITVLTLSGLQLKTLPDYIFSQLPNLNWLDVRFNKLITIPLSIRMSKRSDSDPEQSFRSIKKKLLDFALCWLMATFSASSRYISVSMKTLKS